MKSISKILMVIAVLLSAQNTFANIKNAKTVTAKISGSCQMSETAIKNAGNVKRIANVEWNMNTHMATITFDSTQTDKDEILKRIALAGYDNEAYLAPDRAYSNLSNDCQYKRTLKPMSEGKNMDMQMNMEQSKHNHSNMKIMENPANHNHTEATQTMEKSMQNALPLQSVFDTYFALKNALVNSNAEMASLKATELVKAIKAVEMSKLSDKEHGVWMDVIKDLTKNAEAISDTKDIEKQRKSFAHLSVNMYELAKVSKHEAPIYYQYCPMKDENWLSKNKQIKNPYYGSQMMSCGSTKETLE